MRSYFIIMPWYRWNIAKVGVKYQSINKSILFHNPYELHQKRQIKYDMNSQVLCAWIAKKNIKTNYLRWKYVTEQSYKLLYYTLKKIMCSLTIKYISCNVQIQYIIYLFNHGLPTFSFSLYQKCCKNKTCTSLTTGPFY